MNEDLVMELEDLRLAVYRSFAATGQAPTAATLAAQLGTDNAEVKSGLERLAHNRHVVLSNDDDIVMAHPFSAVPLGFAVMGQATLWWGGCAWDSFALPQLVREPEPVLVATRCPACDTPHAWNVGAHQPPDGDEVAHFLVPAAHMWDDVVHTCGNQRILGEFFRNAHIAHDASQPGNHPSRLDLPDCFNRAMCLGSTHSHRSHHVQPFNATSRL